MSFSVKCFNSEFFSCF